MVNVKAIFCLLCISWSTLAQNQSSDSSSDLYRALPADAAPLHLVNSINWNLPLNQKAKTYKSAFEMALKSLSTGNTVILGNRFLVITPGCGSECQVVGLLNLETGVATLADFTALVGVSFISSSRLLIVDPPEALESVYGEGRPSYAVTTFYTIDKSGKLSEYKP